MAQFWMTQFVMVVTLFMSLTQDVGSVDCDLSCYRYSWLYLNIWSGRRSCTFSMEKLIPCLYPGNKPAAQHVTITIDPWSWESVELIASPTLLETPYNLTSLALHRFQLILVLQHFSLPTNTYPKINSNEDVYNDLLDGIHRTPRGLFVRYRELPTVSQANSPRLNPIPGTERITDLTVEETGSDLRYIFPSLLRDHHWPELRHLRLHLDDFNITDIMLLKQIAPKLRYVELKIPINAIPLVMPFDWDLLSWRTGFSHVKKFFRSSCPADFIRLNMIRLKLNGKISSKSIPPIYFEMHCHFFDVELDLSNNGLTSLGYLQMKIVAEKVNLNFSYNNLEKANLKERINTYSNIHVLDLSHNNLSSRNQGSNFFFPELKELYLQHNKYTSLPEHTNENTGQRTTIKDLHYLRVLDMSFNYLKEINPEDFGLIGVSKFQEINFQQNELTVVPTFLFNAHVKRLRLNSNKVTVNLAGNNISDLDLGTLTPSQISDLHNVLVNFNLQLDGNPLNCGCHRYRMFKYLLSSSRSERSRENLQEDDLPDFNFYHNGLKCTKPAKWAGISLMQIPEEDYDKQCHGSTSVCPFSRYNCSHHWKSCPMKCHCFHSWNTSDTILVNCSHSNLQKLPETLPSGSTTLLLSSNNISLFVNSGSPLPEIETLDLGWNNIKGFPAFLPQNITTLLLPHNRITNLCNTEKLYKLKVLDLSWNLLQEICPDLFSHLPSLERLMLANNKLKQLPTEVTELQNLKQLILSNNLLKELPEPMKYMEPLELLDISGNTLRCNCDTFWLSKWLASSLSNVSDSNGVACYPGNPFSNVCFSGKGRGKRLLDLTPDDVGCSDPVLQAVQNALIATGMTLTAFIVMVPLIFKYRGHIKILLYTRFGFHPWDKGDENYENMEYDAFVAFSRQDEHWVLNTLMPYLEAPQCGFHLCVHDRDFVPGAHITTNIITAIQHSRRTILVLTPDFIKSGWCNFEFDAAHLRSMEDRSNHLIVVMLKDVDIKDLDKALQLYLETNTYVCANDNWFWQKMLYALPKVPIDKLKAQQQNRNGDQNQPIRSQNMKLVPMLGAHDNPVEEARNVDVEDCSAEADVNQPFRRRARRNYVQSLPPLFRHINTYNDFLGNGN